MNLYLRLIVTLIHSLFKKKIHPLEKTSTHFRVMPWDLDALGHLNNGRFLQIADVARVDWLRQTRILDAAIQNRWGAVLGGNFIRYCKVLRPFQRFFVTTRVLSWDTRWIFIEHRFECAKGDLVAVCYSRAALRSKNQWVTTKEITDVVVPGLESPEHSQIIQTWLRADDALVNGADFEHIARPHEGLEGPSPISMAGHQEYTVDTPHRCANY